MNTKWRRKAHRHQCNINAWSKKRRVISNKRKLGKTKKQSWQTRDAVKELLEQIDVFITNGDKGSAVAICETKNYIIEANWQPNVASNYKNSLMIQYWLTANYSKMQLIDLNMRWYYKTPFPWRMDKRYFRSL